MGVTINNESTTTEPPPSTGQEMLSSYVGLLTIAMYHHRETLYSN